MRAKFVHESISFERGLNPKQVLGIGGFDVYTEWKNFQNRLNRRYLYHLTDPDVIKRNNKLLDAWKKYLEDTFLNRKVSGLMSIGNFDSWGAFHQMETESQIERVELDDPPPYFCLITIEPGHYIETEQGDQDEVWYRPRANGEKESKLYFI